MARTAEALQQLLVAAEGAVPAGEALAAALECIPELRRDGITAALDESGVPVSALARALGELIRDSPLGTGVKASAFYAALISLPDAPVSGGSQLA